MGIKEEIRWLKENESGWGKTFEIIAENKKMGIWALKEACGDEDWWPIKAYVKLLSEHGLVTNENGNINLTEQGGAVFDIMKATEDVKQV